jgi:hypothetical protein
LTADPQSIPKLIRSLEDPIVVLANGVNPLDGNVPDGYQQRVAAIDAHFERRNRVYIRFSGPLSAGPSLTKFGLRCFELDLGGARAELAYELMRHAAGVYCHSIYALASEAARQVVSLRHGPLVLDLHGAVPEEAELEPQSSHTQQLKLLETWAVLEADALVHVTDRMRQHIVQKYPWTAAQQVVCPLFRWTARPTIPAEKRGNAIVYAGGTQPWQQVHRIVEHAVAALPFYRIVILTPDPMTFCRHFSTKGVVADGDRLTVRSAQPAEVWDVYAQSRFGILYREDNVINRVACPTKLAEYLHFGLLPVLGPADIGDFRELGMNYAPIEAMDVNALPQEEELAQLVTRNFGVIDALQAVSERGVETITSFFSKKPAPDSWSALNAEPRGQINPAHYQVRNGT